MIIDNDGVALHVAEDGTTDGPVVLILHGITSCTTTWDWLVPFLERDYRVLRLDFRGHGDSARAPGTYHFPSYLSDAVAVCEQLADGPCVVLGHSLGGGTAAALAQQHPHLVRGIVLEDPALAARGRATEALADNSLLDAFRIMRQSIPMLQMAKLPVEQVAAAAAAAPGSAGGTLGETMQPDALHAMAVAMLHVDAEVLDPVLDGSMVTAFDPNATIPVPTLVLAADESASPDAVVRQADIGLLATHSPHAEVRVIAGAGHLIHDSLAHRDTLRDAVLEFVAAHAG